MYPAAGARCFGCVIRVLPVSIEQAALFGICRYLGHERELSFRLGMRPWIAVAYSAPVMAATAVFVIYQQIASPPTYIMQPANASLVLDTSPSITGIRRPRYHACHLRDRNQGG